MPAPSAIALAVSMAKDLCYLYAHDVAASLQ